jgi:site-specific recombinase XerD
VWGRHGGPKEARSAREASRYEALDLAGAALDLAATAAAAERYARGSKAASTRRAYELDWRDFTSWCAVRGLQALPADPVTVGLYLADSASRLRVATIARRMVSIGAAHKSAGLVSPTGAAGVRAVWAGIQRAHGVKAQRKTPLVIEALRACLAELDDDLRGRRDRAILLIGFAGALRRSELVAIHVDDVEDARPQGMVLRIPRSKTDPFAHGRVVGIPMIEGSPTCPCAALQSWLVAARIQSGPVFRAISSHGMIRASALQDRHVARLVKRVADAAGLQGDYSGHSLRAGLATTAAAAGASERSIMAQTGHKSLSIARSYIRPASLFAENAAALAGL